MADVWQRPKKKADHDVPGVHKKHHYLHSQVKNKQLTAAASSSGCFGVELHAYIHITILWM
jgi:hypothetical protein